MSADGERWFLLHASPDVRQQIDAFPRLWPRPPRASPIAGVLVGNADLDACLGLLTLRESASLSVWATARVREQICANSFARVLGRSPEQTRWHALVAGESLPLVDASGRPSGLRARAVPARSGCR